MMDELIKKYKNPQKELASINKTDEGLKSIQDSGITKEYRIMEHALSTRYDPDMPGVMTSRVGDGSWQSEMTKKVYDYNEGYSLGNGDKIPGSNVSQQSHVDNREMHSVFDTREGRLGQYKF